MSLRMTQIEREDFLAQPWVAVISIPEASRGPLTVPVWYLYEPGQDVRVWTARASRKAKLLRATPRISLCVQQPAPPYKYVSVEGPVVGLEPLQYERDLLPLAYRYLGQAGGDQYLAAIGGSAAGAGDFLVRMRPEHWRSQDFSKMNPAV